jgi:hypothetical protein
MIVVWSASAAQSKLAGAWSNLVTGNNSPFRNNFAMALYQAVTSARSRSPQLARGSPPLWLGCGSVRRLGPGLEVSKEAGGGAGDHLGEGDFADPAEHALRDCSDGQ